MSQNNNNSGDRDKKRPERRQQGKPKNPNSQNKNNNKNSKNSQKKTYRETPDTLTQPNSRSTSRGEAIRAGRRNMDDAGKRIDQWNVFEKHHKHEANFKPYTQKDRLRVTFLGGLEGIGEKNMMVLEYGDSALVVDCGFDLSVDLPGINYAIPAVEYLEGIRHKIKGYAITHGHMDHIAGLPYVVSEYPAPIYCASLFCAEMIKKQFENISETTGLDYEPEVVVLQMDNHERYKINDDFTLEFLRITHSIPDCSSLIIETPLGNVVNTGDFRLDPEPLDHHPSDLERLKKLGKDGNTLVLMSDSTNARYMGRTKTEHTLQKSFHDIFEQTSGRIFVALFSTNMNRSQMIINSAVAAGRKVAFDGRGMMQVAEISVRTGNLKIPKGQVVPMREAVNVPDDKLVVVCTGGQGEPNAALQRMSIGEHKHIKLKADDTVVISSSPIPGNEVRYQQIGNDLAEIGVKLYRHPTHEIDGCGPLHVSGHANRDEQREMVEMVQPKYFLPIHGGMLDRRYHGDAGIEGGVPRKNIILPTNGSIIEFDGEKWYEAGEAPAGAVLVDQTGAIVNGVVVKDRLLMSEDGIVTVILTIDKKSGQLLTSPDIISRGFIYMRDSEELMNLFRSELKRAVLQRYKRIDLDRFKAELRDYVTHFLYEQTQRNPIVIPVVNIISGRQGGGNNGSSGNAGSSLDNGSKKQTQENQPPEKSPEDIAKEQQERFAALRQQLLGQ